MLTRTISPRFSSRSIQLPSSCVRLKTGMRSGSPVNEPVRASSWPPATRLMKRMPRMPCFTAAFSYCPRGTVVFGASRPTFPVALSLAKSSSRPWPMSTTSASNFACGCV